MDLIAWLLLLGVLVCDTASHLCLKGAAMRASALAPMAYWPALLRQPLLWLGIAAFPMLFLCWLAFIGRVPLAQGVMVGSITIVGVMVGGRIFFAEHMTRPRSMAIGLIALGVLLVGWGGQ